MKRQPQSDGAAAANVDAGENRKRPRQDDGDGEGDGDETHPPPPSESAATKPPAPKYGAKEYWEARYKSHNLPEEDEGAGDGEGRVLDGVVLSKEAAKAGHEWYFTYDELRPLIMPLILGEDDDNEVAEGDYDKDAESWVEEEGGEGDGGWVEVDEAEDADGDKVATENDTGEATAYDKAASPGADGTKQPISGDSDAKEESEEADHPGEMLDANHRPKRILEIGCGDKPLGAPLAADLDSMQSKIGIDATAVVEEILCVDYSEIVVQSLVEAQKREQANSTEGGDSRQPTQDANKLQPTFRALDARSLPLPSDSYDLILEKGTLDAMLSDEAEGLTNCVQIVKEMARVTAEGGAILIVSHLNANEPKGMGWLEDTVFRGLKEEFDERQQSKQKERKEAETKEKSTKESAASIDDNEREYVWSVEVHGGDGKFIDAEGEVMKPEDVDEDAAPIYGPAVYVAKKKGVPASIARELFGKKKMDGEDGDADDDDDDNDDTMEMPPVKLVFLTY
ncbi:hypothetical protein ACHAXT_012222 [Thalassiosira profunda]